MSVINSTSLGIAATYNSFISTLPDWTQNFLELFGLEENYFDADHLVTPTP